nr:peptide deformylase [Angustibacter aerolatus]
MVVSMHAAEGVGLAANQVGVDARVFVIDCPTASGERVVGHVVNPEPVPARRRALGRGRRGLPLGARRARPRRAGVHRHGARRRRAPAAGRLVGRRPGRPLLPARGRPPRRSGLRRPAQGPPAPRGAEGRRPRPR